MKSRAYVDTSSANMDINGLRTQIMANIEELTQGGHMPKSLVVLRATNSGTHGNGKSKSSSPLPYTAIVMAGRTVIMAGPAAGSVQDALEELLDTTGERLSDKFTANGEAATLNATAARELRLDHVSAALRSVYYAVKCGTLSTGSSEMNVETISYNCGLEQTQCSKALEELEVGGLLKSKGPYKWQWVVAEA